jgi:hypothetical protein
VVLQLLKHAHAAWCCPCGRRERWPIALSMGPRSCTERSRRVRDRQRSERHGFGGPGNETRQAGSGMSGESLQREFEEPERTALGHRADCLRLTQAIEML